ncbi:MAG: hypothetical protein GX023_09045 [Tissierellia bacterium]|nr:hypothetical protein [Tissierellia bacterium]
MIDIVKFPREIIKSAFHYEIIQDVEVWMDMLENRNLLAHTDNRECLNFAIKKDKRIILWCYITST